MHGDNKSIKKSDFPLQILSIDGRERMNGHPVKPPDYDPTWKPVEKDSDVIIEKAVENVIVRHSQRKNREDTLLYRLIRGGNVQLVARTLDVLKARGLRNEKNWVLGLRRPPPTVYRGTKVISQILKVTPRILLLSLTSVLVVVFTPVFYMLHAFFGGIIRSLKKRISKEMDLPLAFAVFSENEHMVTLFVEQGVHLDQVDGNGNNVFHYLVDLSIDDLAKATDCLEIIQRLFPLQTIRKVLVEQENHHGITPLEAMVQFGSLKLLKQVSAIDGIIRRPILSVSEDSAWVRVREISDEKTKIMSDKDETFVQELNAEEETGYRVCRYDISNYEQGDLLRKQSLLLTLMSDRNYMDMDEAEVEALSSCEWIAKWHKVKVNSTRWMYILRRILTLFLGLLFIYYLTLTGGDHRTTPLEQLFTRSFVRTLVDRVAIDNNMTLSEAQMILQTQEERMLYGDRNMPLTPNMTEQVLQYCPPNVTKLANGILLDGCQAFAFGALKRTCPDLSDEQLLADAGIGGEDAKELTKEANILSSCIFVMEVLAVMIDTTFRLVFLFRNYPVFYGTFLQGLSSFLSSKIPGSYVEKQMGIFFSVMIFIYYGVQQNLTNPNTRYSIFEKEYVLRVLMIICLICMVLFQLYTFRLFPVIGLFIMTSVKLLKNLMEFLLAYMIVGLGFSVIFHFLLRDDTCPSQQAEGFENIFNSMYSIYLAMLGQGDFPGGSQDDFLVKLTYFIYSVLTVVMLLNLIIAVMGTTSDRVMVSPFKEVLHSVERLSIALYDEALVQMVTWPLRMCGLRWLTRTGGLVYFDAKHGQRKVYVEVEYDK